MCHPFHHPRYLRRNWDVSSVQTLNSAFTDAAEFVEDLSSWNVAAVTDTSFAFRGAAKFDHNLGSWLVDGKGSDCLPNVL